MIEKLFGPYLPSPMMGRRDHYRRSLGGYGSRPGGTRVRIADDASAVVNHDLAPALVPNDLAGSIDGGLLSGVVRIRPLGLWGDNFA